MGRECTPVCWVACQVGQSSGSSGLQLICRVDAYHFQQSLHTRMHMFRQHQVCARKAATLACCSLRSMKQHDRAGGNPYSISHHPDRGPSSTAAIDLGRVLVSCPTACAWPITRKQGCAGASTHYRARSVSAHLQGLGTQAAEPGVILTCQQAHGMCSCRSPAGRLAGERLQKRLQGASIQDDCHVGRRCSQGPHRLHQHILDVWDLQPSMHLHP